jgi:hypothetical protein
MRTYRCPQCGYDGFKLTLKSTFPDMNVQPMCPACMTLRGRIVYLVETSEPRDEGMA